MVKLATKTHGEREDEEADRLVRPAPKKKPPRRDKRRERMQVDDDSDTDDDPDLNGKDTSMNYKVIGGSTLREIVHLAASSSRPPPLKRVPARSKETGEVVMVSPATLKKETGKYEEIKPDEDEGAPGGDEAPKAPPPSEFTAPVTGEPEKKKTEKKRKKKKEKPAAEEAEPGDTGKKPEGEKPEGGKAEEPEAEEEKPPPEPTVAEKHGISTPKMRRVSGAERAEANLLIADNLPPELAAKLIAEGIHPDDARNLVSTYKAGKARSVGPPGDFAAKAAKIYQTDPDKVEPPKTWRTEAGKKVPFESLSPEEQAQAYRQHQMQVVAMSLASRDQLREKLTFGGKVPRAVSDVMASVMLRGASREVDSRDLSRQVFEQVSKAAGVSKITEKQAKSMLESVQGDEAATSVLQAFLEGNDYKRAKEIYLGQGVFSERDSPADIAKGLKSARDFFQVKGEAYGMKGHGGARHFEAQTLGKLRQLEPEKYRKVKATMDAMDAEDYRRAQKKYEKERKAYEKAYRKWSRMQKGPPPKEPGDPPIPPVSYGNVASEKDLRQQGSRVFKDLFERMGEQKTARRVASNFLISSYVADRVMAETPKSAIYHGIAPGVNYPSESYPKWRPIPPRDMGEQDFETILASAKDWLGSPVVAGLVGDQKFRHALDLGLASNPYKIDIQSYNSLLARLQGESGDPELVDKFGKYAASDREKLEKKIYAKFPPDSKRKSKGKLTVMLTGRTADDLKKPQYTTVALSDLSESELNTLAQTMRVKQATTQPNNGASQMLRLSSEQKNDANKVLASFDTLAQEIQDNYQKWGLSLEVAKGLVNRLDKTADQAETLFYGERSLQNRQAEVALRSEDFVNEALSEGLIEKSALDKAAKVVQREPDEPYMDTFRNPMEPIETDADEPYMSAYGDDQSSSVIEGEDETGRELAPEA